MGASPVTSAIVTVGLLELLTAEFITDLRLRNVIMIRDSVEGSNLIDFFVRRLAAERVHLAPIMQGGEPSTVTTVRVAAEDIHRAREALLRRLAGVQESLWEYTCGEGFWH